MRLRTANRRRKRRLCGYEAPKGVPFCYVVYGKRVVLPIKAVDPNGFSWTVDYETVFREWKRQFPNYGEAIAHLTRVKLAIDEEGREWQFTTPCKIVEGCYTKSGKEIITKEVRLNDECDRPPERHFGSGLSRPIGRALKQGPVRVSVPIPKIVGNPYQRQAAGGGWYTNPYVESDAVWSSRTTTSSSSTTTVDADGMQF